MPKRRRDPSPTPEDVEASRLAGRADPYSYSFRPIAAGPSPLQRPSRGAGPRPRLGRFKYGNIDVPAYTACYTGNFPGVVVRQMPGSDVRHAVFTCAVGNNHYLFNSNDSREFRPGLPFDGFHTPQYNAKYIRPMMQRDGQIELTWNPGKGECYEFAQQISRFWHHPRHLRFTLQQRQALLMHVISVCCGAESTREFSDRLWEFA